MLPAAEFFYFHTNRILKFAKKFSRSDCKIFADLQVQKRGVLRPLFISITRTQIVTDDCLGIEKARAVAKSDHEYVGLLGKGHTYQSSFPPLWIEIDFCHRVLLLLLCPHLALSRVINIGFWTIVTDRFSRMKRNNFFSTEPKRDSTQK